MECGDDDFVGDPLAEAVRAASIALSAKKKVEKAARNTLDLAYKELKRKGKIIDNRKIEARKKTMTLYFHSSRSVGAGHPLSLVLDDCMPDVLGAEPFSGEEYPSDDNVKGLIRNANTTSVFVDMRLMPNSSSGSGDTLVLSAKSPLITILEDSEEPDNSKLVEVPDDSEGSTDNSDFDSPPSKRSAASRKKSGKFKV